MSITELTVLGGASTYGLVKASIGAAPQQRAFSPFGPGGQGYFAGSTGSKELGGWHPFNRSPDNDVLQSKEKVTARARDLDRNNGWAIGGLDKRADAVVGANLRLRSKPDWKALGQTPEWADEWARNVESLWRQWANDVRFMNDVERHQHFGAQVKLAYMNYVRDGAACAAIYFIPERGAMFGTSVLVVDTLRLSNPAGRPDGPGYDGTDIRGGVELDRYGAAIAYHVRDAHPGDYGTAAVNRWTRVPRESVNGRPLFVHAINKRFAHQHQSLSRLAAAMPALRTLDRYQQLEFAAAMANSTFGMYVSSPFDSDFVREALAPADDGVNDTLEGYQAMRMAYHEQADITLDGVRLAHLFPNEKIETVNGSRAATNYEGYTRAKLREVGSTFGLSGEQISNDWTGINYSSARTLLNEIHRGMLSDRHVFTQSYCTPPYAAWLEEAVARDMIEVPGGKENFYQMRNALCACEWIGPGRGWIDPLKEAEAAEKRIQLGISSQTDECAEQGRDAEEVRWQRKRDMEEDRKYGLLPAEAAAGGGGSGTKTDPRQDPNHQDNQDAQQSGGGSK